uniref:ABC transporter ATP-binding protein n=1 Tax=Steinernema glaseri TaxID=37863 RepID=A0A1I7Z3B7_9BILA
MIMINVNDVNVHYGNVIRFDRRSSAKFQPPFLSIDALKKVKRITTNALDVMSLDERAGSRSYKYNDQYIA